MFFMLWSPACTNVPRPHTRYPQFRLLNKSPAPHSDVSPVHVRQLLYRRTMPKILTVHSVLSTVAETDRADSIILV